MLIGEFDLRDFLQCKKIFTLNSDKIAHKILDSGVIDCQICQNDSTVEDAVCLVSDYGVLIDDPSIDIIYEKLALNGVLVACISNTREFSIGFRNIVENFLAKSGFGDIWFFKDASKVFKEYYVLCKKKKKREPKLSIIMPVYNEEKTIEAVLDQFVNYTFNRLRKELVIVESNSTDNTRSIVKRYEKYPWIKVIYEKKPKGKGFAVRHGLKYATGDFIAIQDGDLEYDINDYEKLLKPLIEYQYPFILGSRYTGNIHMRKFEDKVTAAIMNFGQVICTCMINLSCHTRLTDPFTMYKIFRRECLYGLHFECNRFDLDWEIVLKIIKKGYTVLEIPVFYNSRPFSEGKKVSMIKDPVMWLRAWIRHGILFQVNTKSVGIERYM